MKTIEGDLLEISSGVICQQVNCQNAYGAGLSGVIARKWPQVEKAYRDIFTHRKAEDVFGLCQPVRVSASLVIVNIFSQLNYSNSYKTGVVSTDMDKLVSGLRRVCEKYPGKDVYVPYKIGCGLAGGDWDDFVKRCEELPIAAVRLPGTR